MGHERALEHRRILVVEDEYLIASDIVEVIRKLGGEVVGPCSDLASSRQTLAEAGRPPDGAVLDLNLKGESVAELAHDLNNQGVPLIYYTGYQTTPEEEGLPEAFMIVKPLTGKALMQKVTAAFARARVQGHEIGPGM